MEKTGLNSGMGKRSLGGKCREESVKGQLCRLVVSCSVSFSQASSLLTPRPVRYAPTVSFEDEG